MLAAIRAARFVGQSSDLLDKGRLNEAHAASRQGLALLRRSYVHRHSPPVASALASLTVLAEQSAPSPASGASREDLADSLAYLRTITGEPEPDLCQWIPLLEARLLSRSG